MEELLLTAEVILSILGFLVLLLIYKQGVFSPVFLISGHLYLGCVLRYFYLLLDEGQKLHYSINVEGNSFWEMQIFFWLYIFSLFFLFKETESQGVGFFKVKSFGIDRYRKVLAVSVFFVSFYLLYMVGSFGSLYQFVSLSINRVSENVQGLAYVGVMFDFSVAGSLFLFYYFRRLSYRQKIISGMFVLALFILLGLLGGRGNFIQYIISIFIIADCVRGRVTKFDSKVLMIALVFIIMSTAGLALRKASQQDISFSYAASDVSDSFMNSIMSPWSLFDHYELAKEYQKTYGFDYGLFYLEQLTRPIPRALWPEKPQVLGKKIRDEFWGDDSGGVPAGYIGESYISFGVIGISIAAIVLAFLSRFLQNYYRLALKKPEYCVFVAMVAPYVSFNLIRTGLDTAFTRVTIYVFAFMLFKLVTDYKFKWK